MQRKRRMQRNASIRRKRRTQTDRRQMQTQPQTRCVRIMVAYSSQRRESTYSVCVILLGNGLLQGRPQVRHSPDQTSGVHRLELSLCFTGKKLTAILIHIYCHCTLQRFLAQMAGCEVVITARKMYASRFAIIAMRRAKHVAAV